ncbi:Hypothetical predicted protein [Olea europaea subsp. europaea]|uniref:Leucine-rich repeat-containing N-terminal plant-type domain-containing protein n=1 Tax=Olea europaea subsp. europaea TaxID=158383 RepID=A0A8S0R0T9_OLEEU|nr:Hypothetical predicted protein [Olea europaea subsp. europaea]
MASYLISLVFVFVFAFAFSLLLVSSEYGGPSERVPVRSSQPSFNPTKKAFSLATRTTNPSDVVGVFALWSLSPLTLEWQDDPCLPPQLSWIECNTDTITRITALYLGGKSLSGFLPDISYMDDLVTIDLHQNMIFGAIPSYLGTLPKLKELYLANNLFSGSIPDSVACNKNLKLSLTGNPLSTTSNKCLTSDPESPATRTNTDPVTVEYPSTNKRKKSKKLPIILGSGGSVVGVFWIIVGIFAIFRHKAKAAAAMAAASAPGHDGAPNDPNLKPNPIMSPSEETPINPRARDSP